MQSLSKALKTHETSRCQRVERRKTFLAFHDNPGERRTWRDANNSRIAFPTADISVHVPHISPSTTIMETHFCSTLIPLLFRFSHRPSAPPYSATFSPKIKMPVSTVSWSIFSLIVQRTFCTRTTRRTWPMAMESSPSRIRIRDK